MASMLFAGNTSESGIGQLGACETSKRNDVAVGGRGYNYNLCRSTNSGTCND